MAMSKLNQVRKLLGEKSKNIQTLFVSVDPERDKPEKLKSYVTNFDPNTIGVTGTLEELNKLAKQYAIYFKKNTKTKSAAGYLIDHHTYIFLIDQKGKIRYIFKQDDEPQILAKITNFLL